MSHYYFADGTSQRGPFPVDQLLTNGLRPDMLVWTEGMANWLPASQVPDVASVFLKPTGGAPAGGPPIAQQAPFAQPPFAQQPAGYPQPAAYPQAGYAHPGQYPPGQYPPGQYPPGQYPPGYRDPAIADASSKKFAAGLCAILIGSLGIHKFILGRHGAGVTMLLITVLTCFMASAITGIIGLVEGIIMLTKSDEEFYRIYIVEKKAWF